MFELQIKQALKNAGLDEGLSGKIIVKSEAEIADAVKKLGNDMKEEGIKAALKEKGLDGDFDKILQSKIDSAISKAISAHDQKKETDKLAADKAKADEDAAKKAAEDAAKGLEGKSDIEKILLKLTDSFEFLSNKVATLETNTGKISRESKIKTLLAEKKLSENLLINITGEDDQTINAQISAIETEIQTARQAAIDLKIKEAGGDPLLGGNSGSSKDTVVNFAKARNAENSANTGGAAAQQIAATAKTAADISGVKT